MRDQYRVFGPVAKRFQGAQPAEQIHTVKLNHQIDVIGVTQVSVGIDGKSADDEITHTGSVQSLNDVNKMSDSHDTFRRARSSRALNAG